LRVTRENQRREDGLSSSLQIAKAAEHLVCADLILQGWNAFLADAGLPYDVLVDLGFGQFSRIQVKSTTSMMTERPKPNGGSYRPIYRFALRRSRTADRRITLESADVLACVALDRRIIAYLKTEQIIKKDGDVPLGIEMKTRALDYSRRGVTGIDSNKVGRFMEDHATFIP